MRRQFPRPTYRPQENPESTKPEFACPGLWDSRPGARGPRQSMFSCLQFTRSSQTPQASTLFSGSKLDKPELCCLSSIFASAPTWSTLDKFRRVFLPPVADCSIKWRTIQTALQWLRIAEGTSQMKSSNHRYSNSDIGPSPRDRPRRASVSRFLRTLPRPMTTVFNEGWPTNGLKSRGSH
jgi:hypothetical protein